jgi:hypothetical protein
MSAMPRPAKLILAIVIFVLIAFFLGRFGMASFYTRWRNVKDGMSQREVRKALGTPTQIGASKTIGAGNQPVTRWEYRRGHCVYWVDFDYIGPGGAPLVFRTERFQRDWEWPSWWPFARAKARA